MKSVLIVDSVKGIRGALRTCIEQNYQVFEAETLEAALRQMEDRYFDVMILDVVNVWLRPNTRQMLNEVRRRHPEAKVIVTSADAVNIAQLIAEGAFAFLPKNHTLSPSGILNNLGMACAK